MNERRRGACSWEDPLGDLFALFPELRTPRKTSTSRPAPIPLRSTVPTAPLLPHDAGGDRRETD